MRRFFVCAAVGTIFTFIGRAPALAQALPATVVQAIDKAAHDSITKRHVPSVVIVVSRHGKVVYNKAFGYRNLGDAVPATVDTRYQYGSVTKQFTAMGIFLLAQAGKLSLDDPIAKYIPSYAGKGPIKISNLLVHTSGVASCTDPEDYALAIAPRRDLTLDWCINYGLKHPLDFPVGAKTKYSNTGYVLLERIITTVSHDTFDHFVTTRLLKPTGMMNAMPFDADAIVPRMAAGYSWLDKKRITAPYWYLTNVGGAGYLIGEAADLMHWDEALMASKLLQPKWQKLYLSPGKLNNGKLSYAGAENPTKGATVYYLLGGLGGQKRDGVQTYGANGGTAGFLTYTGWIPSSGITITTLTNLGGEVNNADLTVPILDALLTLKH